MTERWMIPMAIHIAVQLGVASFSKSKGQANFRPGQWPKTGNFKIVQNASVKMTKAKCTFSHPLNSAINMSSPIN